jgi:hypothetical protein
MLNINEAYIIQQIELIIYHSRHGDELFFTDYKRAAADILQFLEREMILIETDGGTEVKYYLRSQAA